MTNKASITQIFKLFIQFFIIAAFIISLLTFIFTPFTGDLYVLFAGSHQADMLGGSLIGNAFRLWDLKGAFYRLFLYIFYKAAVNFADFQTYGYVITVNILFCLSVIAVVFFSVIAANGSDKYKFRINLFASLALSAAVFACHAASHIQAEMICVVKIILSFGIYINALRTQKFKFTKLFVSGLILGSIFFYKSVFALMALAFTAGALLWSMEHDYKFTLKDFLALAGGGLAMLAFGLALIFIINPGEINNMLNAAVYQPTFIGGTRAGIYITFMRLQKYFRYSMITSPVIFMGFIFGALNFFRDLFRLKITSCALRAFMWIIPAVIIVLANCYFMYHYFLFVSVSIFELACSVRNRKSFLAANILMLVPVVVYLKYISLFSLHFQKNIDITLNVMRNNNEIVPMLRLDKNEPVMYLDGGIGAYIKVFRKHV